MADKRANGSRLSHWIGASQCNRAHSLHKETKLFADKLKRYEHGLSLHVIDSLPYSSDADDSARLGSDIRLNRY